MLSACARILDFLPESEFQRVIESGRLFGLGPGGTDAGLPFPSDVVDAAWREPKLQQEGYNMVKEVLQAWFMEKAFQYLRAQEACWLLAKDDGGILKQLALAHARQIFERFDQCSSELLLLESALSKSSRRMKSMSMWICSSYSIGDFPKISYDISKLKNSDDYLELLGLKGAKAKSEIIDDNDVVDLTSNEDNGAVVTIDNEDNDAKGSASAAKNEVTVATPHGRAAMSMPGSMGERRALKRSSVDSDTLSSPTLPIARRNRDPKVRRTGQPVRAAFEQAEWF